MGMLLLKLDEATSMKAPVSLAQQKAGSSSAAQVNTCVLVMELLYSGPGEMEFPPAFLELTESIRTSRRCSGR